MAIARQPASKTAANHLADQASPYLRAHANDPVAWVPWGERALRFARRTGRPLLISIGYQSCHWCHVMQRESFSDTDTAGFINRHFVPVKVDRETRPDVDAFYMNFVSMSTGAGGWPLTVFATPDGVPFYGGTYFPSHPQDGSSSFVDVLDAVLRSWTLGRANVEEGATEALEVMQEAMTGGFGTIDRSVLDAAAVALRDAEDRDHGGFGDAPKFPQAPAVTFLTGYATLIGEDWPAQIARRQVLAMLRGGSYDQVGGGLFRYATDAAWRLPHFEKMLSDQGLLLSSLAALHHLEPSAELAYYARATHGFLSRELAREGGGFNCALDAETSGVEGGSYLWRYDELEQALTAEELEIVRCCLGARETGDTPDGDIVLNRSTGFDHQAAEVDAVLLRLADLRSSREMPALIDNVITSWNALAARGLIEAGAAFDDHPMLDAGLATLDWLLASAVKRTDVLHIAGDPSVEKVRFLEDYATLVAACLSAAEATGDQTRLETAAQLHSAATRRFQRQDGGLLMSSGATGLPFPPLEVADNAIPAGASLLAENALRLARAGRGEHTAAAQALAQFARTARVAPYLAGHALAVAAKAVTLGTA